MSFLFEFGDNSSMSCSGSFKPFEFRHRFRLRVVPHVGRHFIVNKKSQISFSIRIYSYSLKCLSKMNHIYTKSRDKCQSNNQICTVPDVLSNRNEFITKTNKISTTVVAQECCSITLRLITSQSQFQVWTFRHNKKLPKPENSNPE